MGKSERDKGSRFERKVAQAFGTERVGTRGKRDKEHADVEHDVFFIQCKHYKRMALFRWFEETSEGASKVGKTPILVLKEDRNEPVVVIGLDAFFDLLALLR